MVDLLGEILQVGQLLSRQARGPQLLVGRREELRRRRSPPTVQREHAAMNCRGGLARELLVDDRARERVEVRAFASRLEAAWADKLDDSGENGIDALEVTNGR